MIFSTLFMMCGMVSAHEFEPLSAPVTDLFGRSNFQASSKLTVSDDKEYLLPSAIVNNEAGTLYTQIRLSLHLPNGMEWGDQRQLKVLAISIDSLKAHPGRPYSDFATDISSAVSWDAQSGVSQPVFVFQKELPANTLFFIRTGISARCHVLPLSSPLHYSYSLQYVKVVGGVSSPQLTQTLPGNSPLNSILTVPVLVISPQENMVQVAGGEYFTRRVVIRQTGQMAELGKFRFTETSEAAINYDLASIRVNGTPVTPYSINGVTGFGLVADAAFHSPAGKFREGDSIVITYSLSGTCPKGEVQSKLQTAWGDAGGTVPCALTTAFHSFNIISRGSPKLVSTETIQPYDCAEGIGMYAYSVTNTGNFLPGYATEAAAHKVQLLFDSRQCHIVDFASFELVYNGQTLALTPVSAEAGVYTFDIWKHMGPAGLSADANNSFVFRANYRGNCADPGCYINCNTSCRKPFIELLYQDQCGKLAREVFHRVTGTADLLALPCNKPQLSLVGWTAPAPCTAGQLKYSLLNNAPGPISEVRLRIEHNGCPFYTVSGIHVNGATLPVSPVTGGWECTIPGPLNGTSDITLQLEYVAGQSSCQYPNIVMTGYTYCGGSGNSQAFLYSGQGAAGRIAPGQSSGAPVLSFTGEADFTYCSPGSLEYTLSTTATPLIKPVISIRKGAACSAYVIDSIAVNGYVLPGSAWQETGGTISLTLSYIHIPGWADLDQDGYANDMPAGQVAVITLFTGAGTAFSPPCQYPTIEVAFGICNGVQNLAVLTFSGKPSSATIRSLSNFPRAGLQTLSNNSTDWVNYCKTGNFRYSVNLASVGTIHDLLFVLDKRGCDLYKINSVSVNGFTLPAGKVKEINGIVRVDISNFSGIPGLVDADGDGYTDDASGQPVYITFHTNLNEVPSGPACCRQPRLNLAYRLCGSLRDSVSTFLDNTQYCLPSPRPSTIVVFDGYTRGGYCVPEKFAYTIKRNGIGQMDNILLQLNTHGCNDYTVYGLTINGAFFPASAGTFTGGVFTFDLKNTHVPIPGFMASPYGGGKTDAFAGADSFRVEFLIVPQYNNINCQFPSMAVGYRICGSAHLFDTLAFSGQPASEIVNAAPREKIFEIRRVQYDPVSYCEQGSILYRVNFLKREIIGGIQIEIHTRNNRFYQVDGFQINGVNVPSQYISREGDRYFVRLHQNTFPFPGFFNAQDSDNFLDETDSSFTLRMIISLPCLSSGGEGEMVEGIDGTCTGPMFVSYWPTVVVSYDRCLEEVRFADTLLYSGYASGILFIADDAHGDGRGLSNYKLFPTNVEEEIMHVLYYRYRYHGIKACPNDTQMVFRVEFPDLVNNADSIDGFRLNYIEVGQETMSLMNQGYLGHKADTLFTPDGLVEKVILYIYFDQSAAYALGPSSTHREKSISFMATGRATPKECDFVEYLPPKVLRNYSLSFIGKDASGITHCRYERLCRKEVEVKPIRNIPPCICISEWAGQKIERISFGFDDNTLSSPAQNPDNLSQGGKCDTFQITSKISRIDNSVFDTLFVTFNTDANAQLRILRALHLMQGPEIFVKGENGQIKPQTIHHLIDKISPGVFRIALLFPDFSRGSFTANDTLFLLTKWYTDISNVITGTTATQIVSSLVSYDKKYTDALSTCPPDRVLTPYTLIRYNHFDVKQVNEGLFENCGILFKSNLIYNSDRYQQDYWQNEFRPHYYLDSIVLLANGVQLDYNNGAYILTNGGDIYEFPPSEVKISYLPDATKIVFYNKSNRWPIKKHAFSRGELLYQLTIPTNFSGCCYQITGQDSSYRITYYYDELPGRCSEKSPTKVSKYDFLFVNNITATAKTLNVPGCAFNYEITINNDCREDSSICYPNGIIPKYIIDSLRLNIGSTVILESPVQIINIYGQQVSIAPGSPNIQINTIPATNTTYLTLYNDGSWPPMVDVPGQQEDMYRINARFGFQACCYVFNEDIDQSDFDIFYTSLQSSCVSRQMGGYAEALSVHSENAFFSRADATTVSGCMLTANTGLYSTCPLLGGQCYPGFIDPVYEMDSVSMIIRNRVLHHLESAQIKVYTGQIVTLDPAAARIYTDGVNTFISYANPGNWPLITDTLSSDMPLYQLEITTGLGACCLLEDGDIFVEGHYYFNRKFGGCASLHTYASAPARIFADDHAFASRERFFFNSSCGAALQLALVNDNRYAYLPEDPAMRYWVVDSISVVITEAGMIPGQDISLITPGGAAYALSPGEYTIRPHADGLELKLYNTGNWPLLADTLPYGDTLYLLQVGLEFTGCCNTISSPDAEVGFGYTLHISDYAAGHCRTDMVAGTYRASEKEVIGNVTMASSLVAGNACTAHLEAWVGYACPAGDCSSVPTGMTYVIDSIAINIYGAQMFPDSDLRIYRTGDSMAISLSGQHFINGDGHSILTYHNAGIAMAFSELLHTSGYYHLSLPFRFGGCGDIKEDLQYEVLMYYSMQDNSCNSGTVASTGHLHFEQVSEISLTPVSGLRNQVSIDGKAEWVFDIEKSSLTDLLWVGVKATEPEMDDIQVFHIYDVFNGQDSLLSASILADGGLVAGIRGLNYARILVRASLPDCREQSVHLYAGTSCYTLPQSLLNNASGGACGTVAVMNNSVITDSSGIQGAFLVDPTTSGLKACDTLTFVYELKNVKRSHTYDHSISFVIPANYMVDPSGWGYLYPFDKQADISIATGEILRAFTSIPQTITYVPHPDGLEYRIAVREMDAIFGVNGLPGNGAGGDALSALGVVFRVFTSCDFDQPGYIVATASALAACKSETVSTQTNTSRPTVGGTDLSALNSYSFSLQSDAHIPAAACGIVHEIDIRIINESGRAVMNDEWITVQLPSHLVPSLVTGTDAEGFDWDRVQVMAGSLRIPMPIGNWQEKLLSIPYTTNAFVLDNRLLEVSSAFESTLECAATQSVCPVFIPTGQNFQATLYAVRPSLVADTVLCFSDELLVNVVTDVFAGGTGVWSSLPAGLVQTNNINDSQAKISGARAGNVYTLTYLLTSTSGTCTLADTMQLTVLSCGLVVDTLPATQSIRICPEDFGRQASDVLTLCSGTSQGSGNAGSWYVSGSCLVFEAGTETGSEEICVEFCNDKGEACETLPIFLTVVPRIELKDDHYSYCEGDAVVPLWSNDLYYGNPGELQIVEMPFNGMAIIEGGVVLYLPDPDFVNGFDTLYYSVCDKIFGTFCDTAMVVIRIGDCPVPPVAVDDHDTTFSGQPLMIQVLANDYDPDGSFVKLCNGIGSIVHYPSHGSVSVMADSIIVYVPVEHFIGVDSFRYVICDADGLTDTAWVHIAVVEGVYCEVPNGFSPNGDGINDYFVIPCEVQGARSLRVWNRWGAEVFFSPDYQNNWDGSYKGKLLPGGTYFYSLRYPGPDGKETGTAGYVIIYQ